MHLRLLALFLMVPLFAHAQLRESFADGDLTQDPAWSGDAGSFIVTEQGQLQSSGPAITGTTLQLTTPSLAVTGTVWEFWANLKLATSSGNYADVWLLSDGQDLGSGSGYFVRLGGTADEVSLFRKDAGKSPVAIVDGEDKTLGSSTGNAVRVRVSRSVEDIWQLDIDLSGSGQHYVRQGSATDATYKRSAFFGVLLRYSSANSQGFFFDDFTITDTAPPLPEALQLVNPRELTLRFNEPLQPAQAGEEANFTLNSSLKPLSAELTEANTVRLVFGQNFSGGTHILNIAGLSDLYGNTLSAPVEMPFDFVLPAVLPGYNQLLITEIMADETPALGLPAQEYIELYNPTDQPLSLQGIRFSDATSTATLPDVQLLPQEYAVVVPGTQAENFRVYGKAIGVSNFPGLNNSGEVLQLRQPNGTLIYALSYSDTWYKDSSKQGGGWSLEMIDVTNPCAGSSNWAASSDALGGTPGKANSVAAANPDRTPPVLTAVTAVAPTQLLLRFNERLDSAQAAGIANYSLSPTIPFTGVEVAGPLFTEVTLQLAEPLQEQRLYTFTASGLTDCSGNLGGPQQLAFALPSAPEPGDVVINEILFNPRPNGVDFVELVNRSQKYIDLRNWQLANTSNDSVANHRLITTDHHILEPGQYIILTTSPENIRVNYPAGPENAFLRMSALPSYINEAGTVVVLQPDGRVADRFSYDEAMHFELIDDVKGVSLERVRLEGPTQPGNFHSASTRVFATPGYINSQAQEAFVAPQLFQVEPVVFSPDGDGHEDFTTINYSAGQTGLVASITVFDAQGREIRRLARNELLAADGFFQWDGLREDGAKASMGYYLFYIELFDLNGQKREYKEKVVVGGRF